jgi:hypothetical protein
LGGNNTYSEFKGKEVVASVTVWRRFLRQKELAKSRWVSYSLSLEQEFFRALAG